MNFNRDAIKLSFEKPIYSVNAKKGTVACVLNYSILMPCGGTTRQSKENGLNAFIGNDPWPMNKAVGIAKCSPNDKFDEKIGMEVAEARAESVAYSQANRKIENYARVMSEALYNWSSDFDAKAAKIVAHNVDYIAKVSE